MLSKCESLGFPSPTVFSPALELSNSLELRNTKMEKKQNCKPAQALWKSYCKAQVLVLQQF